MASNERGGLFSAIKELKNILERAPHGVMQADLIDRSPRLRRLSFAEKREVLDKPGRLDFFIPARFFWSIPTIT